jgi:hypothetical protein
VSWDEIQTEEGPARSIDDARERLGAAETLDQLAKAFAALRRGEVDDDLLWAMMTSRYDQIEAAQCPPSEKRRPRLRGPRRPPWER